MARSKFTVTFPAAKAGDEVTWPNTVKVYGDNDTQVPLQSGQSVDEALTFIGYSEASSITFKHEASGATVTVSAGGSGTGPAASSAASSVVVTVSVDHNATAGEVVLADPTSAAFNVQSPTVAQGAVFTVRNIADANAVTVVPYDTEQFDAAVTKIVSPGQSFQLVCDGTDWWTI